MKVCLFGIVMLTGTSSVVCVTQNPASERET